MANTSFITKKQQQLLKDPNPNRFYTHFLFKALLVTIFCIVLPVFTSRTPEFSNQTRIWELLHLIFVGIAVSYGLFSRRTDETGKENSSNNNNNQSKFDNAHSYVSRFLQVSSVFDEESENESGPSDERKVQTWSNRYYRNEPEVVVAKDDSVLGTSSRISDKPLLLPVRSLKSRVLGSDSLENAKDSSGYLNRPGSNSGSKRFSRNLREKSKNGEVRGSNDHVIFSDVSKENNIVLPSPIPWQSRSGRMEVKEIKEENTISSGNTSTEDADFSRVEPRANRPQTYRSSRPNSASSSPNLTPSTSDISSPRKSSPLPSFSSESLGKSAEDFVKKKSFFGACPPPPPPPPLPVFHKSASTRPGFSSLKKDLPRSYTSEPKDLYKDGDARLIRPRIYQVEGLSSMAKAAKTIGSSNSMIGAKEDRVFENGFKESMKKNDGFDQETLDETETVNPETGSRYLPNKGFMEFPEEGNLEFLEKRVTETHADDVYSDDDDDGVDDTGASSLASRILGSLDKEEGNEVSGSISASDDGPDVNQKADEFIAKFREQIRLQRIESIKRSTSAQIRRNSSR